MYVQVSCLLNYFLFDLDLYRSKSIKTHVIGCPKTIDGDLKCKEVPTSFGFDTACKVNEAIQIVFAVHFFVCIDLILLHYFNISKM